MSAQPVERGAHVPWSPDPVRQQLASYNLEDVLAMPDDAPRVELRDGVMIVVPSPTLGHNQIGNRLWAWLDRNAPREYVPSTATGVLIGLKDTLEPDVLLVRSESFDRERHYTPCDQVVLVIEIVSPGTKRRDRFEKPGDYAGAGIPFYWRVEQNPVRIYAYELAPGDTYRLVTEAATELVLTAPFDIRLPVADLAR